MKDKLLVALLIFLFLVGITFAWARYKECREYGFSFFFCVGQ